VLDHRAGAAEPGQVAGLSQDGRDADCGQPIDRADEVGQVEFVQDGGHPGLDLAQPAAGVPQVSQGQPGTLQRTRPLGADSGRISQAGCADPVGFRCSTVRPRG
jgi:hypothetical protein